MNISIAIYRIERDFLIDMNKLEPVKYKPNNLDEGKIEN